MKLDSKLTTLLASLLGLAPLYLLSSGPLLHYSAQPLSSQAVVQRPGYPTLTVKSAPSQIQSLYAPMFQAAAMTHLEGPLFAYLRMWNIFPARWGNNQMTPVLLEKQ